MAWHTGFCPNASLALPCVVCCSKGRCHTLLPELGRAGGSGEGGRGDEQSLAGGAARAGVLRGWRGGWQTAHGLLAGMSARKQALQRAVEGTS